MCIGSVHWMWGALTSLTPSPPARPSTPRPACPPRNTWPRHATGTHRAYQWEIDRLVDGVGDGESPAHAPRFLYRLGIHRTVWRFGLTWSKKINLKKKISWPCPFPPSSWVYHKSRFNFFWKFGKIFAAQGAPPLSTIQVANEKSLPSEKF